VNCTSSASRGKKSLQLLGTLPIWYLTQNRRFDNKAALEDWFDGLPGVTLGSNRERRDADVAIR
jgi:hypothetical protein